MNQSAKSTRPGINLPLSVLVPLALIAAVALTTWWNVRIDRNQVAEKLRQQTIDDVTLVSSGLEARLERALRSDDREQIQEEIATLATNREYTLCVLVDEQDDVIHSMRLGDIGKKMEQVLPADYKDSPFLQPEYLGDLKQRRGGKVNATGQKIIATYPLVLGMEKGELRPSRMGNLILMRDYTSSLTTEMESVTRNALKRLGSFAFVALGLGLFFHFAIARRLNQLARFAEQFGAGQQHDFDSGVSGHDEVASLAWSMERMMADKAESDRGTVESEQRLQSIMESAIDVIITIDERGIIQTANPATQQILGYQPEEIIGKNVSNLMPSPYTEAHDGYLANYLRTGNKKIIGLGREVVALHKSGRQFPIDLSVSEVVIGEQRFFLGVIRDVTERKESEKALRIQERAIEAAVNGILITDPLQDDNPIIYANPAITEITGYEVSEVVGKNCRFMQADDREQEAIEELRAAIEEERECRVILRNYKKDGTLFWNELTVSPARDKTGKVTNFVGIQSDITKRIEAVDALDQLNEQLEERVREKTAELVETQKQLVQKEKLATLGQVSGGIAHEIRNPLNAISTSAYYLLHAKEIAPEKQREHLERVDRQVKMINNVVTALSDVAKLPAPTRSSIPIRDAIQRIVKEISMPANIKVDLDFPDDLCNVLADEFQLPIVFRNLVRNARDAMPEGGTLSISAKEEDGRVVVAVKDTGVGIAPEDLERITEPLYSTKARGMGLGLAISQAVLEKNSGQMKVASELGQGTEFTIELEAAEGA